MSETLSAHLYAFLFQICVFMQVVYIYVILYKACVNA